MEEIRLRDIGFILMPEIEIGIIKKSTVADYWGREIRIRNTWTSYKIYESKDIGN